jgi:carboxyl-terminal processing protease
MVLSYVDNNRSSLKQRFPAYSAFEEGFVIDEELIQLLVAEGEKEEIQFNQEEFAVSKELAVAQLKALIARDLFTSSEYFQSINPISEAYQKAVEIVESKRDYSQYLK